MKRIFITLIISFFCVAAFAQKRSKIYYVLPDAIEKILDSCINQLDGSGTRFYFLLRKDTTYSITIGKYMRSEKKNILKWVLQSNRYVIVNKKSYPLVLDYDLKFGSIDNNNIGNFGVRDGQVKKASLIIDGTTIYFKGDGAIMFTDFW